eukprot:jgi/Mesvir1/5576/Mv15596-RA.1
MIGSIAIGWSANMRFLLLAAGICVISMVPAAWAEVDAEPPERNSTLTYRSRRCDFGGRSGALRLCAQTDCGHGNWLSLRMNKLSEVDASGRDVNNSVATFGTRVVSWSDPVVVQVPTVGGGYVNATFISFDASHRVGSRPPASAAPRVNFTLNAWIFDDEAFVYNGNSSETVEVPKGSLKFNVQIADWPFLNASNHLQFSAEVTSGRNDSVTHRSNVTDAGSARQTRFELGSGIFLRAPNRAIVDGVLANVSSGLTEETMGSGMAGGVVAWTFPHFNGSILFDPVISFAENTPPPPPSSTPQPPPPPPASTPRPPPPSNGAMGVAVSRTLYWIAAIVGFVVWY